jgi:hypothetical protein
MSDLHDVSDDGFSTKTAVENRLIRIRLSGNADMSVVSRLDQYLKSVHDTMVRLERKRVVVDMHELYFMNSSCLKALVSWITKVQGMVETSRYRIELVANPNLHWQRRSLAALRNLGGEAVDVVTE